MATNEDEPHVRWRGGLRNENRRGDLSKVRRCGAMTRRRTACAQPAMLNPGGSVDLWLNRVIPLGVHGQRALVRAVGHLRVRRPGRIRRHRSHRVVAACSKGDARWPTISSNPTDRQRRRSNRRTVSGCSSSYVGTIGIYVSCATTVRPTGSRRSSGRTRNCSTVAGSTHDSTGHGRRASWRLHGPTPSGSISKKAACNRCVPPLFGAVCGPRGAKGRLDGIVDRFEKGVPNGLPPQPETGSRARLWRSRVLHSVKANTLLAQPLPGSTITPGNALFNELHGTSIAAGTVGRTPRLLGTQTGSCDDRRHEEA